MRIKIPTTTRRHTVFHPTTVKMKRFLEIRRESTANMTPLIAQDGDKNGRVYGSWKTPMKERNEFSDKINTLQKIEKSELRTFQNRNA